MLKWCRNPQFEVPSKVCHEIRSYIAVFWPKSNVSPFLQNWGSDTTLTLLTLLKMSKVGQNSLSNQKFMRDFKGKSTVLTGSSSQSRVHRISFFLGKGVACGGEAADCQPQSYLWYGEAQKHHMNPCCQFHIWTVITKHI